MKADNLEDKEVSSFRGCGELGASNKVNRLGEPVHNGEYGCVTVRGRKASNKVELDVGPWSARRSSKIRADRRPRTITVRFHHLAVKELVMKLARYSSGLRYDNSPVFFYPDLSADILQKHQQFTAIKEKCKARKIRYGFSHPAKFFITVGDCTKPFVSPENANTFLTERVADWELDRNTVEDDTV